MSLDEFGQVWMSLDKFGRVLTSTMLCLYEFLWYRFEKFLGPIFHTMLGPPVVTTLCRAKNPADS